MSGGRGSRWTVALRGSLATRGFVVAIDVEAAAAYPLRKSWSLVGVGDGRSRRRRSASGGKALHGSSTAATPSEVEQPSRCPPASAHPQERHHPPSSIATCTCLGRPPAPLAPRTTRRSPACAAVRRGDLVGRGSGARKHRNARRPGRPDSTLRNPGYAWITVSYGASLPAYGPSAPNPRHRTHVHRGRG